MYAIPRSVRSDEQVTGLGCPDCSGVLAELAAFLGDLVVMNQAGAEKSSYEERASRAGRHERVLRQLIAENAPTPVDGK